MTDIITDMSLDWLRKRDKDKPFLLMYQHKAPHREWEPALRHLGHDNDRDYPERETLFDDYSGRGLGEPGADGADPTLVDIVERANKEHDVRIALAAMIFGGVFERYPRLKVGAVEFEVAWVPYFLARMDNLYTEQAIGVHGRRFTRGARAVFLLVSSAPGRLLPTIRSRCRTLSLQPLSNADLRAAAAQAFEASGNPAPTGGCPIPG